MAVVVEITGENGVSGPCCKQCFDIRRVRVAFGAGQKSGSHPDGVRPLGDECGHSLCSPDPAGRNHRHSDGPEYGGQQLVEGDRPPHMASRLHPLSDNEIASSRLGSSALVDRANLPRNESPPGVPGPDQAFVRIAFEELHDPHLARLPRYRFDWRPIRDQKANPGGAEFCLRRLHTVWNHAEAAPHGNRGGEVGRPNPTEHRELEGQSAADETGESRAHCFEL